MAISRVKKPRFTIDDLLTGCVLNLEARNLAAQTILLYEQVLGYFKAFLVDRGCSTVAADIERRHIQAWLKSLFEETSPRTGRPLTAVTVDIRFRTLRAFWNWAVHDGYIDASPRHMPF